jgi:hypothetical protein
MNSYLNPWLAIWFRPRATIRSILDDDPGRQVLLLSMLWGASFSINAARWKSHGDLFTVPLILTLAVILAPSGGFPVLYLQGLFFAWVGRLLGGKGRARDLRAAFAWSSVPNVVSLILLFPAIALFGSDLFTSSPPRIDAHPLLFFLLISYALVELILLTWGFVIFIKCVAEAHHFSSWRGLTTVISWPVTLAMIVLVGCLVYR